MANPRELGYEATDLARHPGHDDPDDYRHPFARDYDRLVHTTAFRRLQGKTGVVAPGEADFFRTRARRGWPMMCSATCCGST